MHKYAGNYVCPPYKNSASEKQREEYADRDKMACCEHTGDENRAVDCHPVPEPTAENPGSKCPAGTEVACCWNVLSGLKEKWVTTGDERVKAGVPLGILCVFPGRKLRRQETYRGVSMDLIHPSNIHKIYPATTPGVRAGSICPSRTTKLYCPDLDLKPGSGSSGACVIDADLLRTGDRDKIHCCTTFTPVSVTAEGATHDAAAGAGRAPGDAGAGRGCEASGLTERLVEN